MSWAAVVTDVVGTFGLVLQRSVTATAFAHALVHVGNGPEEVGEGPSFPVSKAQALA